MRTDLFSFGLLLYEMAIGKRAFVGETAPALHDAVLNRSQRPARELNPELPPELDRIISTALEKGYQLRYQSASALRVDLELLKMGPQRVRVAYCFCIIDPVANDLNNHATLILPTFPGRREPIYPRCG
jgi:serine/threonine protein kinase